MFRDKVHASAQNRYMTKLASCVALLFSSSLCFANVRIAVTVDDLPRHGDMPKSETRMQLTDEMLDAFDHHHLKGVYGFINALGVEQIPEHLATLREWVKRGQFLGNHTYSHADLTDVSVSEYEQEILKNEPTLQQVFHGDFKWFRFPYLDEGKDSKHDQIRAFLAAHGYRIAEVSMSFDDWSMQSDYAAAVDRGDTAAVAALEKTYLDRANAAIPPGGVTVILLSHIGAFTAHMMDKLLTMYEQAGAEFVSLPEAAGIAGTSGAGS